MSDYDNKPLYKHLVYVTLITFFIIAVINLIDGRQHRLGTFETNIKVQTINDMFGE